MKLLLYSKKASCCFLIASLLLVTTQVTFGQLFQQNFSTACSTQTQINAAYVSATPDNHHFTAISSSVPALGIGVSGNALRYTRSSSGTGTFSRISNFGGPPKTMQYQFFMAVSGATASTNVAQFKVGGGSPGFSNANTPEVNSST